MARTLNDVELFPDEQGRLPVNEKNKRSMKKLLNRTGPGFCLAKWTQVTMHLGVGLTHSCHHPSPHKIPEEEIKAITKFADNNLKVVKFIPEQNTVMNQDLKRDFYGLVPVLEFRTIPLDNSINLVLKRIFDIFFSISVILFVLSWLTPILAILIKLESKGPILFKQLRNGYNYKSFNCFKFRSMIVNEKADLIQVSKQDERITRIGKFMRKTSIDELPQFLNVLTGDMSVVGPRPHMLSHTSLYANKVDKFMVRHFVKPGITGLAQVSGYRGEVESDKDIVGRVKFDIFYIENWSI